MLVLDDVGTFRLHDSLTALRDRVAALDETLVIESPADGGTMLTAVVPLS